ncbi:hypothetical protein ACFVHX_10365, partial [Streptomyces parvus]
MTEETILLRDFLATMNRLQAEFERRLDGIEQDAPPGGGRPLYGSSARALARWGLVRVGVHSSGTAV